MTRQFVSMTKFAVVAIAECEECPIILDRLETTSKVWFDEERRGSRVLWAS